MRGVVIFVYVFIFFTDVLLFVVIFIFAVVVLNFTVPVVVFVIFVSVAVPVTVSVTVPAFRRFAILLAVIPPLPPCGDAVLALIV